MNINEILLALFDFVPCILCFLSMLMLQKCLYHQMSKYSFAMLASGTIMVLFAGISKATWKLLYFSNVCDFRVLNDLMFPVQAFGFTFAFLGVIIMFIDFKRNDKNEVKTNSLLLLSTAPALFEGTFIFVIFQVLGTFGIFGTVSVIAFKKKKPLFGILMIAAAMCYMVMAGLSSAIKKTVEGSAQYIGLNWAAESVNTLGQVLFYISMKVLSKLDITNLKELFKKKTA